MASSSFLPPDSNSQATRYPSADFQVWESLKQAIAESSGFKSWKIERHTNEQPQELSLDTLVHNYLRETLETLAY